MMTAPTSGAPPELAADPAAEAAPASGAGYKIEIHCDGSGQMFKVGVEPAAEESAEPGATGEGDEEGDFQSVGSVGEVCKLVREIVAHAGQMADTDASAQEMGSGYGANT